MNNKILLQGQPNFRDLGGYFTLQNKKVKDNVIFRSGQLHTLTKEDTKTLEEISLKTLIDFRTPFEIESQPHVNITTIKSLHTLNIMPGNITPESIKDMVLSGDIESTNNFLKNLNKSLVLENQKEYTEFFKILQENTDPLVFNCSAGKDRTGLAAALLLHALGVDTKYIIKDYLNTNDRVAPNIKLYTETYGLTEISQQIALKNLLTVQKQFIDEAFNTILQQYGSINDFLTKNLQVDIPLLQEKYLEEK